MHLLFPNFSFFKFQLFQLKFGQNFDKQEVVGRSERTIRSEIEDRQFESEDDLFEPNDDQFGEWSSNTDDEERNIFTALDERRRSTDSEEYDNEETE